MNIRLLGLNAAGDNTADILHIRQDIQRVKLFDHIVRDETAWNFASRELSARDVTPPKGWQIYVQLHDHNNRYH